MNWIKQYVLRRRHCRDLSEEIREHLAQKAEELVAAGMSTKGAVAAARREFGNVTLMEEDSHEVWRWSSWENFVADVRYSLRLLRKTPAFTLIAITILAIGIGSNTAVFSLIDALLLRSLAVPRSHELVQISFGPPQESGPLSGPMFDRLRERQGAFRDLFAWTNAPMVFAENGVAKPIQAAYASGSAFPTLEIRPRLGRLLDWNDDELRAGSNGWAAVISETFWIEHFQGDANVLGKTILVSGAPATIVGVMPRSFTGITVDYSPEVVLPFAFDVGLHGKSSGRFQSDWKWLFVMGRLKPGVTLDQAKANVATIACDVLKESLPTDYRSVDDLGEARLFVSPGRTGNSPLGKIYGRSLWTLQALVGLLLLMCCANLAGLQLSRGANRQREMAVRSALGAGRWRLVRQLTAESATLAIAGCTAGLFLSHWMSSLLVRYIEQSDFPVFLDLRPNAAIFACAVALAGIAMILTGALPALNLTRADAEAMLKSGTQRSVGGATNKLAARLLPFEVALSVLLVSLALLFAVSAGKLLRIDPGFRVKGVTLFGVDFDRRPEKGEARLELYRSMLDALRHSPGVESASVVTIRPLGEGGMEQTAAPVEGNQPEKRRVFQNIVGPDYFATAGTRVLAGREFSAIDRGLQAPVCIVNQSAANSLFPGQNVLGKHIWSAAPIEARTTCEVVGIVTNAKYNSVREPAPPTVYYSFEQASSDIAPGFITRSRDVPAAFNAFRDALHRVAPDTPLLPAVTMQRQLEDAVGQERLLAALSLFFGGLALTLTALGLYGLESQRVTQRTAEIGVRMALGAQRRDLFWFILREAALFFVLGIPIGLAITALATRFVGRLLYELSPLDPRIYAAALVAMLAVGFLAAYLPARRAMQVDPMVALRHE